MLITRTAFAFLLGAVPVGTDPATTHAFKPERGEIPAALDKHLEYVDGSPLDLGALKGKPTVL